MTRDDAWLDAFDDDDFTDPELAAVDAAVERLAPTVRRRRRWVAPLAVAAVLLVGIGIGWWARPDPAPPSLPVVVEAPVVTAPPVRVPTAPTAPVPPAPPPPAPVAAAKVVPAPVERAVAPPPPIPAPEPVAVAVAEPPPPSPGLLPAHDARVRIADGTATLAAGLLTYVHDATHEPGVRRVAWVDLDIAAVPVGTAFRAVARPRVGALSVSDGRVRVVHDDGTVLAELDPGDEVAAVPDLAEGRGVSLIPTAGLPLDAVRARVPDDCLCRPEDVVASVAALRLAAMAEDR